MRYSLLSELDLLSSLAGGALIGSAAASLLLLNGNILGASGILSSVAISPGKAIQDPAQHWKLVFLGSFLLTARFFYAPSFDLEGVLQPLSPTGFSVAGFLVGFGTELGNGCTSGHGICGLARLSKRSFVAVMTFMAVAAATVAAMESVLFSSWTEFLRSNSRQETEVVRLESVSTALSLLVLASAVFARWFHTAGERKLEEQINDFAKAGPASLSGMLFAHGLHMSGMLKSSKVAGFFDVAGSWDSALAIVMIGGLAVSSLSYQLVFRGTVARPLALAAGPTCKFQIPTSSVIDRNLVAGAAVFGLGWGIAGICPGPGLFLAGAGIPAILQFWLPSFVVGAALGKAMK